MPYDKYLDFHCKAEDKGVANVLTINGDNTAHVIGRGYRIYINDPDRIQNWLNVETTWSVKALKQVKGGSAFVVTRGANRSNHQNEFDCSVSGNGYYGEAKWNNVNQLKKEMVHKSGGGYCINKLSKTKGVPKNVWEDYKVITVDVLAESSVKGVLHQFYRSPHLKNEWELLVEALDTGNWMITGDDLKGWKSAYKSVKSSCKKFATYPPPANTPKKTPTPMLTLPAISNYIRGDNVEELIANISMVEIDPIRV